MSTPQTSSETLEREFLEIRAKILQIGASLDRIDRGAGSVASDSRLQLIRKGLEVLLSGDDDRAEQIQLIFSREYDDQWQDIFFPAK
jgi:hypothetical protein